MIVCPVCEHAQAQGAECERCGKVLVARAAPAAAVAPLAELERTLHVAGPEASVQPLAELEATRLEAAAAPPAPPVADLEPTRGGPVGAIAVAPLPELDTGREVDGGARTAAPTGAVTCRYCRNVQSSGLLCERCGMRLPRARAGTVPEASAGVLEDGAWTRCHKCHSKARATRACPECGAMVQPPL